MCAFVGLVIRSSCEFKTYEFDVICPCIRVMLYPLSRYCSRSVPVKCGTLDSFVDVAQLAVVLCVGLWEREGLLERKGCLVVTVA